MRSITPDQGIAEGKLLCERAGIDPAKVVRIDINGPEHVFYTLPWMVHLEREWDSGLEWDSAPIVLTTWMASA